MLSTKSRATRRIRFRESSKGQSYRLMEFIAGLLDRIAFVATPKPGAQLQSESKSISFGETKCHDSGPAETLGKKKTRVEALDCRTLNLDKC